MEADPVRVERLLGEGELECPKCSGVLSGWGHGRPRVLRGFLGAVLWLRPRRARCSGCGATHILLSELALPRRADTVLVIGAGLELAARGTGHRSIARQLGVPDATVRGWLRRFTLRAEEVRSLFTALLGAVDENQPVPEPTGSPVADAVLVVLAAARAGRRRSLTDLVSSWSFACRSSGGTLLAVPGHAPAI